jgi:PAP2 superfamily C-terminal
MSCEEKWNMNVKRMITLTVLFCVFYTILKIKSTSIKNSYKEKEKEKDTDKLSDVIHTYGPDWSKYYQYAEIFFYIIILLFIVYATASKKLFVLYEIGFLLAFFYFIKITCTLVTILPDPSGKCETKNTLGDCNELMPSGHLSSLLIILFSLWPYIDNKYWKMLFVSLISIYSFVIIAVRNHYTIDVVISWFVVYTIYYMSHPYMVNNCKNLQITA